MIVENASEKLIALLESLHVLQGEEFDRFLEIGKVSHYRELGEGIIRLAQKTSERNHGFPGQFTR